ncbi:MAG TPA: hypothetical protein VGZ69_01480 [Candidatus Rhabdochlamydia sp.]|jgi:hypothetical protein|nr:hypothetical protein [Candidatus Rhabdochlamydia sp.]
MQKRKKGQEKTTLFPSIDLKKTISVAEQWLTQIANFLIINS